MSAPPADSEFAPMKRRWMAGLIALATLICYLPATRGDFLWDDPDYIAGNLTLRNLHGLWQIWTQPSASPQYYPLVFSSFWLEYHVWGLHTFGYHALNVLLHIGSAMLLWRIVDALRIPGGWLAATIFALHPMNVESVAWISERKNVLSAVFYLLAMRIYLNELSPRRWMLALLFFIAALLSKSVTATWPAAMLVILWWRNGRVVRRDVLRLLPFFLLSAFSGALTAYVERAFVGANGAQIAELDLSMFERCLIAGRAIWFYCGKLIVPWPLSFIYPRWQLDVHAAWQWAFPGGVVLGSVTAAILSFRSARVPSLPEQELTRRAESGRGVLASLLLYVGTLFPALGFINVYPMRYAFVADHFAYLALPALIVPIAASLVRWFRSSAALVLAPLAVLTFIRAFAFAGPLPLWSDTYAKNPNSWMVCTQLANALNAQHQSRPAGDLFLRAYELSPQLWETQTNAAIVFASRGQTQRGLDLLDSSQRLNPAFPITYFNRGIILENAGDLAGAAENYRKAIELAHDEFPAARQRLFNVQPHAASTQQGGDAPRQ